MLTKKVVQLLDKFLLELHEANIISSFTFDCEVGKIDLSSKTETLHKFVNNLSLLKNEEKTTHDLEVEENKYLPSKESSINQESETPRIDSNLVQVTVNTNELNRRIQAFMKRKRMDINDNNVQEFCQDSALKLESESNCARVDTVVVGKNNSKSHVKVSRMVNAWGPQLQFSRSDMQNMKSKNFDGVAKACQPDLPIGLEERLRNVEDHLDFSNGANTKNVYDRIKGLEEKILFLEGLSPSYFHSFKFGKAADRDVIYEKQEWLDKEKMDIAMIDSRMAMLRNSLKHKLTRF